MKGRQGLGNVAHITVLNRAQGLAEIVSQVVAQGLTAPSRRVPGPAPGAL
jgi:hypothetical protein